MERLVALAPQGVHAWGSQLCFVPRVVYGECVPIWLAQFVGCIMRRTKASKLCEGVTNRPLVEVACSPYVWKA